MHPTRSWVDLTLKEAADALALIAVAAREKRGLDPMPSTLTGGLLGAGLGGLTGALTGGGEDPAGKKRSRWGGALTGALAGGALGGGLGLAHSTGSLPGMGGVSKEIGLPKGQFKDPRTGKLMALDPTAAGDPDLVNKVRQLSERSPATRIADLVGKGVSTAATYAPFSSLTGAGLLGHEAWNRLNVMRNPENLYQSLREKGSTGFLGGDKLKVLEDLKEAGPLKQQQVLAAAAGPSLPTRAYRAITEGGNLKDRLARLTGSGSVDDVMHELKIKGTPFKPGKPAAPGRPATKDVLATPDRAAYLRRGDVKSLAHFGHGKRMGGLLGFGHRAAIPMALAGGADLGLNYLRGEIQDRASERDLRKLMAQYAKPVE